MTKCKKCNIVIEEITLYPHIDILKSGIDIADIPIETLEDLPKPHLHQYYKCVKCKYVEALQDITLLSKEEVLFLKNKNIVVKPIITIEYWKEWLKEHKKK